jgi:hypothetical protein
MEFGATQKKVLILCPGEFPMGGWLCHQADHEICDFAMRGQSDGQKQQTSQLAKQATVGVKAVG